MHLSLTIILYNNNNKVTTILTYGYVIVVIQKITNACDLITAGIA